MAKIDVRAFVQTPMTGREVYMHLNKKIADYAVELYPKLEKMHESNGSLVTKLLKVMYECEQSSKLWFDVLTKTLMAIGYKQSETDRCVMRKQVGKSDHVILIYMDDLLILAEENEIDTIRVLLIAAFKAVDF
jgi:hypothetical protein